MAETTPIWFNKSLSLLQLRSIEFVFMSKFLNMEWAGISENTLSMQMPVNDRTKQPYGLLHGGASCALAETVGSIASFLVIDSSRFICVGQEISASHLRSATSGKLIAVASPLHLGRTTHVWDIRIHNDTGKLVCISRLTVAIRPKP